LPAVTRFSPVCVYFGLRHARHQPAPRRVRPLPPGWPNQSAHSALQLRPGQSRLNPSSTVRFMLVIAAERCRTEDRSRRRCNRTPLLRFRPLQHLPVAMRCPRRPGLRTIPLRRFIPGLRPARPRLRMPAAPLRFFAPRMRCGCARRADVQRLRLCESKTRCVSRGGYRLRARRSCLWSLVRAHVGETDHRRNRFLRAHWRPITSSATASLIRCLSRVMHRRVP